MKQTSKTSQRSILQQSLFAQRCSRPMGMKSDAQFAVNSYLTPRREGGPWTNLELCTRGSDHRSSNANRTRTPFCVMAAPTLSPSFFRSVRTYIALYTDVACTLFRSFTYLPSFLLSHAECKNAKRKPTARTRKTIDQRRARTWRGRGATT